MTTFSPSVEVSTAATTVLMARSGGIRGPDLDVIIDLDDFGVMVGIEILDARRQLEGARLPTSPSSGYPTWSYDEEIDAMYLSMAPGEGRVQERREVATELDSAGSLVSVQVNDKGV